MIFGIGTDILKVERVAATYEHFGERFVERLLLPDERRLFAYTKNKVRFLAMRFAAKEAIVKAMGTGFSNGMWIRDSGVIPNRLGRPEIVFSSRGRAMCHQLGIGGGHLTLSDEAGLVVAVAVLEKSGKDL
ncbi:MAG: holo-ACP synthase [Gammaproteobacteria bacterium]|jgi:holo-[acyl-carrier protein] synthase|nr:holo-ACP synthase [Gammaproteobacteria bacterium]MDP6615847.1 holo-ACP synthase [Gammaproteobacteria bacterium]MDP6694335.1 holo-ACP synthase [Gammaproteobacteria bacterium]